MIIENINDLRKYFDELIDKLKDNPITKIFVLDTLGTEMGKEVKYNILGNLYILLKSGDCIVINYPIISKIKIEYRKLNELEKEGVGHKHCFDLFNTVYESYNYLEKKLQSRRTSILTYDFIKEVMVSTFNQEYPVWCDKNEDEYGYTFKSPNENTFGEIKFIMNNGKEICICTDITHEPDFFEIWCNGGEVIYNEFN